MKIPKFKLAFQTSQIINFAVPVIIEKALAKLHDKKYQVRSVTENGITFRWNPFRLVWNFQALYILDRGEFEITKAARGTLVVFKPEDIN